MRTIDCPDDELLAAWLDRTLIADERDRVNDHLADCARCLHLVVAAWRCLEGLRDRERNDEAGC